MKGPAQALSCPICGAAVLAAETTTNGYRLFLCGTCAHRFAPDATGVPVDYEQVWAADEYAEKREHSAGVHPRELGRHPTYAPFFRRFGEGRGRSLLDVGCGSGRFCRGAQAWGFGVAGIDVSARALAEARSQGFDAVRRTTLDAVVEAGERFEVLTAFEVLEHLEDVPSFLIAARRALAPGGALFFTVPNGECAEVIASPARDHQPPIHRHFFSSRSLLQAGRAAGFTGAVAGTVWTDFRPSGVFGGLGWLLRRALRRPNRPLGLWLHAKGEV